MIKHNGASPCGVLVLCSSASPRRVSGTRNSIIQSGWCSSYLDAPNSAQDDALPATSCCSIKRSSLWVHLFMKRWSYYCYCGISKCRCIASSFGLSKFWREIINFVFSKTKCSQSSWPMKRNFWCFTLLSWADGECCRTLPMTVYDAGLINWG